MIPTSPPPAPATGSTGSSGSSANPAESSVDAAESFRRLLEISHAIHSARTPDELYRSIYRASSRALEFEGFYVSLLEPGRDLARIVFAVERGEEYPSDIVYRGSHSEVIRTGRGLVVSDTRHATAQSILRGRGNDQKPQSVISVPLRQGERIRGAVSAQSSHWDAFSDSDLALLQAIADIGAVAVDRVQHMQDLHQRTTEAERIEAICRELTSSLSLDVVLDKTVEATLESTGVERATLWILEGGIARRGAARGIKVGRDDDTWDLDGPTLERLARSSEPLLSSDLGADSLPPEFRSGDREGRRLRSGALVPLPSPTGPVGILTAGTVDPTEFRKADLRIIASIAQQASVAIENARLHTSTEALSLTDPLTGLPNRRHLMIHLEREVAAAKRGRSLSVVIFDLDRFKQYNDAHGHLAGDEILRVVADVLSSESRAMNFSGRYGGDEFISVISDAELEGARAHARRICGRVEEHPTLAEHDITLSYGIGHFVEDSVDSTEALIEAADEDLYRAKDSR